MNEFELSALVQENAALKKQLAKAIALLNKAAPHMQRLAWMEKRYATLAKIITIVEGYLWAFEIKSAWRRFWSTGELINKIDKAVHTRES